ncbi:hypothetical protein ATCC90586_002748 [Pythium insidiosum]|nr:hypothetical protein ATCC90586_002748 [Pythium insidiosum]
MRGGLHIALAVSLTLLLLIFGAATSAVDFRAQRMGRACGSDRHGYLPCPDGQYCQRISPFQYLCKPKDPRCRPLAGVRLLGDEVEAYNYSQWRSVPCAIGSCCEHCARLPSCVAFNLEVRPWTTPGCVCRPLRSVSGRTRDDSVVASAIDRQPTCSTPRDSVCSFSNGAPMRCCPQDQLCRQISYERYQCMTPPPECRGVRVAGSPPTSDLVLTKGLSMAECCELCKATRGCTGIDSVFLFLETSACNVWVDPIGGACAAVAGDVCGNSTVGTSCCPALTYCQPRNHSTFECVQRPPQCTLQYPMTELDARDIQVISGGNATDCCDACRRNPSCRAYTFYASDSDSDERARCRLKADRRANRVKHPTAVTGYLNAMFT